MFITYFFSSGPGGFLLFGSWGYSMGYNVWGTLISIHLKLLVTDISICRLKWMQDFPYCCGLYASFLRPVCRIIFIASRVWIELLPVFSCKKELLLPVFGCIDWSPSSSIWRPDLNSWLALCFLLSKREINCSADSSHQYQGSRRKHGNAI